MPSLTASPPQMRAMATARVEGARAGRALALAWEPARAWGLVAETVLLYHHLKRAVQAVGVCSEPVSEIAILLNESGTHADAARNCMSATHHDTGYIHTYQVDHTYSVA